MVIEVNYSFWEIRKKFDTKCRDVFQNEFFNSKFELVTINALLILLVIEGC